MAYGAKKDFIDLHHLTAEKNTLLETNTRLCDAYISNEVHMTLKNWTCLMFCNSENIAEHTFPVWYLLA